MKLRILFALLFVVLSFSPAGSTPPSYYKGIAFAPAKKDVTVYVTRTGAKYHRSGCRYLRRSSIAMKLSEACASYTACSVCKPPKCNSK